MPHTIALDSQGRVFVGDRGNNRIEIFDQQGTLLDVWYQFGRPSGIAIGADDRIYVADSESYGTDNPGWKKGIRVGNARDGSVQYLIEDLEPTAIEHSGAEGVGVDSAGNVYGGGRPPADAGEARPGRRRHRVARRRPCRGPRRTRGLRLPRRARGTEPGRHRLGRESARWCSTRTSRAAT